MAPPRVWRFGAAGEAGSLPYEWVAIQDSESWMYFGQVIGVFRPSPMQRGDDTVADVGDTYFREKEALPLPVPEAMTTLTRGRTDIHIRLARGLDWYMAFTNAGTRVTFLEETHPPIAEALSGIDLTRALELHAEVTAQLQGLHDVDDVCLVHSGMQAFYMITKACHGLGRKLRTFELSNYYETGIISSIFPQDDEGDVLCVDFGAFNPYSDDEGFVVPPVPEGVTTILLDITMTGVAAAAHMRPFAEACAERDVDLVVWSSLCKVHQHGINRASGGFSACLTAGNLAAAHAHEAALWRRHMGVCHMPDLEELQRCLSHPAEEFIEFVALRWLANTFLWSELCHLKTPGLKMDLTPAAQFVVMRFSVKVGAGTRIDTFLDAQFRGTDVERRNSFGFTVPVYNTYVVPDDQEGSELFCLRVAASPLPKDTIISLAAKTRAVARKLQKMFGAKGRR
jgi:hypothetical protein